MRKKILAANWKMNLTQPEVDAWLNTFQGFALNNDAALLRVYPSAIYLKDFQNTNLHFGAQNIFYETRGAFTGELSVAQLKSVGCQSVLIGHSERREIFHESDTQIALKVQACANADFSFILCCGEPLAIREVGTQEKYVIGQLQKNLENLSLTQLDLLVVAYEPIWAIGKGLSANLDQINEMHQAIRNFLVDKYDKAGEEVPILYGGSVSPANAAAIFSCPAVDGALVGGAALDASSFYQLWQALNA